MIPLEVIALSPYAPERMARHGRRRTGRRFRDRNGRTVEVDEWRAEDWNNLLAMYSSFDPAQRAQGLPPLSEQRQAIWVERLLDRGPNVVARAGGRIVGHAALVAYDGAASYELVLFVHQDYQGAGIGGALADAILRLARRRGAERVWLTVHPQNERALALYRRMGFQRVPDDRMASPSDPWSGEEVWVLPLPGKSQKTSERWAGAITPIMSGLRVRLVGLAGAVRFAWIPAVCALVVAVASEEPHGRVLALALAIASVCLGLAVHAREIILGRPLRRVVPKEPPMSTGEWMARLR
jgi:diamine N-acetyltransferase